MIKKTILAVIALIVIGAGGYWIYQSKTPAGNVFDLAHVIVCTPEQRNADACYEIYDPVCAKMNIQCIQAPCDPIYQTFSNDCEACKNPLAGSYTGGECADNE